MVGRRTTMTCTVLGATNDGYRRRSKAAKTDRDIRHISTTIVTYVAPTGERSLPFEFDVVNYRAQGTESDDHKITSPYRRFSAAYWGDSESRLPPFTPADRISLLCRTTYKSGDANDLHSNITFAALFTENRASTSEPLLNVTAIFCKPLYYEQ
jgi:hypothetical protein